jgi:hypothetical protein
MPSWGGVLAEINALLQKNNQNALDLVRRKYLASQYTHSKRAVILYATKWTEAAPGVPPDMLSIADGDIQGFMECAHGIKEKKLDLILHSPGGSPAAAEACVEYLRARFEHIRVFVPHAAMSAATMMACAADEIVLGEHSFLGPIDPQLIMQTPLGPRSVPAQAILDQFEKAKKECADPAKLPVWLPMLQQYGPDLLIECENVLALSQEIVQKWLTTYMFKGEAGAEEKAKGIAAWLANHGNFKLHGRYIGRNQLDKQGLKIVDLESDKLQQDFVLSIYHATTHAFNSSGAVKIIENHAGAAFVRQLQQVVVQNPPQQQPVSPLPREAPPFPKKR